MLLFLNYRFHQSCLKTISHLIILIQLWFKRKIFLHLNILLVFLLLFLSLIILNLLINFLLVFCNINFSFIFLLNFFNNSVFFFFFLLFFIFFRFFDLLLSFCNFFSDSMLLEYRFIVHLLYHSLTSFCYLRLLEIWVILFLSLFSNLVFSVLIVLLLFVHQSVNNFLELSFGNTSFVLFLLRLRWKLLLGVIWLERRMIPTVFWICFINSASFGCWRGLCRRFSLHLLYNRSHGLIHLCIDRHFVIYFWRSCHQGFKCLEWIF